MLKVKMKRKVAEMEAKNIFRVVFLKYFWSMGVGGVTSSLTFPNFLSGVDI